MESRLPHRKHASVEEVMAEANKGNAFFVNRAVLNGDLAQLPENQQRKIVAVANDEAARYASDQIIPRSDQSHVVNQNFIAKHLNLAIKVFTRAQGRKINEEIDILYQDE